MGKAITLGGERLGSGKKSKVYLHNYERSTHNLSRKWASSMGVGMLIPFYTKIATRDDKFEIDLSAGLRTIPTKGPLFGSFKLQLDMFQCPLRLYQALLHNNPTAIGLKTNQIKWPKIKLWDKTEQGETYKISQSANNSLIKYLDIAGIGTLKGSLSESKEYHREFFGAHLLAYYDIFKNYYANKQEENAWMCHSDWITTEDETEITELTGTLDGNPSNVHIGYDIDGNNEKITLEGLVQSVINYTGNIYIKGKCAPLSEDTFLHTLQLRGNWGPVNQYVTSNWTSLQDAIEFGTLGNMTPSYEYNEKTGEFKLIFEQNYITETETQIHYRWFEFHLREKIVDKQVYLEDFALKNIDDARMDILSFHQMGQSYTIDCQNGTNYCSTNPPYIDAIGHLSSRNWKDPLSGICVKTYQNDIFNNWINTEWIDGENGIAEITAIATTEGSIKIDALNFAEKLYNLLNRVAASDGTYEGYLDVAYTESDKRFCESPMWIGGLSDEIVFEEIVQTAPADGDPLGALGGRGNLLGKHKGGKITCKIDEPSIIMGIVSITPRIMYTQGNEWHNTELDNLADLHVPALDGIAFQNLMAEQMHFGATIVEDEEGNLTRPTVGKVPAWINYMTDYDRAYGDFAATGGDGYMILNRNYEVFDGELQDATTYIDPAKYNYAFAYTKRDAQNFWVQINCDVKARRLMSAKQIPSI